MSEPRKVKRSEEQVIRSYFDQTGVLITRPIPGSYCKMGVAFKGGNNNESHNHNDVGSFTIVSGKEIMVGDPGAIPYTSNIFDPQYRYTYKTIGSFGQGIILSLFPLDGIQRFLGSVPVRMCDGKYPIPN